MGFARPRNRGSSPFALAVVLSLSPAAARAASPWVPIGPSGGIVSFVASAPSAPQILYAASPTGGVFSSPDSGESWQAVDSGLADLRVQCLAVSPADPRVVYAGTTSGAFKTTDGGASWMALGGGFPAGIVNAIAIDPSNAETLYAAGAGGLLARSTDEGASWRAIGDTAIAAAQPRALAIDPSHTATLYLGTAQNGVYRSSDGGTSWTEKNTGLVDEVGNTYGVLALAVDPTNTLRLYAGVAGQGVYSTTDGGGNWTPSLPAAGLITSIVVTSNGTVYLAIQGGLYALPPGEFVWTSLPFVGNFINTLAVGGPTTPVYVGFGKAPFESGGLARWDGGASYVHLHLDAVVITALAGDPMSAGRALAGTSFGMLSGTGDTWEDGVCCPGPSALVASILFDPRHPGVVYAGASAGVFKSADAGTNWVSSSNGLPPGLVRSLMLQPGSDQGILAGTMQGVFQSSDGGATWAAASADLAARQIFALAADPGSAATVWAGTGDGVYRSADSGVHFARAGTLGGVVHAVLAIAGGRTLAGTDSGLWTSPDGGASWTPVPGTAAAAYYALVEDFETGEVFAGGLTGVARSADGGASFSPDSDGLSSRDVRCLALLSNGLLLAGTNGGSVFSLQRFTGSPREPVTRPRMPTSPRVVAPRL